MLINPDFVGIGVSGPAGLLAVFEIIFFLVGEPFPPEKRVMAPENLLLSFLSGPSGSEFFRDEENGNGLFNGCLPVEKFLLRDEVEGGGGIDVFSGIAGCFCFIGVVSSRIPHAIESRAFAKSEVFSIARCSAFLDFILKANGVGIRCAKFCSVIPALYDSGNTCSTSILELDSVSCMNCPMVTGWLENVLIGSVGLYCSKF